MRGSSNVMKVVAIGGGTGLSSLLRGLKRFDDLSICAVVTITDEGGSSGILREEMGIPPPGDLRNNIIALAEDESILSKLLSFRFEKNSSLKGHNLGNLILVALTKIIGNFPEAVKELSKILAIRGEVLPVTDRLVRLVAKMEDGSTLVGETNIARSKSRIVELSLSKDVDALPEVLNAIEKADGIVLGPGSLYTSVISNLLVRGIPEAIRSNEDAVKIYVSNIMTQPGETTGYTLSDHVREITKYLGAKVDYVIANTQSVPRDILERYAEQDAEQVKLDIENVDVPVFAEPLIQMVIDDRDNLEKPRHDPLRLGSMIRRLLEWRKSKV